MRAPRRHSVAVYLRWRNWPLAFKLTLTSAVLVIVTVTGVTLVSIQREQRSFRSELEQQAQMVLASVSATAIEPLYYLRLRALRELAAELCRVPPLVSVRFYDETGRLLADTSKGPDALQPSPAADAFGRRLVESDGSLFFRREGVLEAGSPVVVEGQRLGAVAIGLSTAPLETKVAAVRDQGLIAALLALALGTVLALLIARSVTQPLQRMLEATRRMTEGDLEQPIAVPGENEFGTLSRAFNQMTDELRSAQEKLLRRQRLATLGELAGSIAHEIRNPLAVMNSSIFFLSRAKQLDDEKAREHLGFIDKEVRRANRIIAELLDYGRASAPEVESLALQAMMEKAFAAVEVPESVRVKRRFEDQPVRIEADPGQIERVLANLLRNAVQAMPHGGALLLVCRRCGTEAVAAVTDTGVGISEDQLSQLFEPLYTSKAKGIGLGLSLSLRYAQLNGGRIECESEPGKGATFRLVLPLEENVQEVEERQAAAGQDLDRSP